ncbi:formate dehydrogenase, chloroplastic/mitochondrial isoform X2 [Eutrema salsugineum]|uniref:formate dehydrogenase, chloroplastic/mitochondrial isoform X2 n=1 Tax=Eutrema salsugineum TaxID=72664 RepID=UPI000CED0CE2|nr:formate dehydrogenase, chloroplastic/mitochondrial isoform X2 [Eutrema salsugineum]
MFFSSDEELDSAPPSNLRRNRSICQTPMMKSSLRWRHQKLPPHVSPSFWILRRGCMYLCRQLFRSLSTSNPFLLLPSKPRWMHQRLRISKMISTASSGDTKKIVGVFYKANKYASKNPNFLGCVENALGIRDWLESQGHQYIVTDDKEGPNCELEKHIPDLHVLISTPFNPAYVTAERIKKAKNLQLLLRAGIGSDHIDLKAAAAAGLTVAEVTGSNVVSVAEDELMRILILMRNFVPGHQQIINGEWNVAGIAHRAYDLEGKTVGTVGAGRIGRLLLQRLKPFGHDRLQMEQELEEEIGAKHMENLNEMVTKCDVIVINTPLTEKTRGMFNKEMIGRMKKGVLIVNNARAAIMERQAVVEAAESGHIGGYSGDVWDPQPAPKDHPWRYMPNQAMTPHISGTTIDAQLRYAAGTKDMLDRFFKGEDFPAQNYIVKDGEIAPQYV